MSAWTGKRKKGSDSCNPVTGEFIDLAKVKAAGTERSYIGYDPIKKKCKLLFLTSYGRHSHVVTFGAKKTEIHD